MNEAPPSRHERKISPSHAPSADTLARLPTWEDDPHDPGEPAYSEWLAAGLALPDMDAVREYRLERVRAALRERDCAGIVLVDPLNTRYATDSTNMQLWCTHNACRYAFVATEGPVIVFDYGAASHLSAHLPLITEVRPATSWFYFVSGNRTEEHAKLWAAEIADLVREYGGGNKRLGIDKCNPEGTMELQALGIEITNGEELMEMARTILSDEEVKAMRCSIHACESAMHVMQDAMQPGITENRLWSYLHAENIARGGEWIETRLLSSGPRTNPWFHESSSRVIKNGDIVAFDTDLIGPYGICTDISRTWICGDKAPTDEQRRVYAHAYEHIQRNIEALKPGVTFREITFDFYRPPDPYRENHYSCQMHGVGLCDEYPTVKFPESWDKSGYDGVVEEGMAFCVESYVGLVGGPVGVKLEEQVLVTADGCERLSVYPYEEHLL
jgi:Xaa-Pro dipeptidase